MSTVVTSNTLSFSHQSYYYHFDSGTGVSLTESSGKNWLAKSYAGYATYWGFTGDAVAGKKINSVKLRIQSASDRYEDKYNISFNVACKTINTSSEDNNLVLRKNYTNFAKYSSTFTLPAGASKTVDIDITDVIQYAADNFTTTWGLYFIGGVITGAYNDGNIGHVGSNGIMITNPTFTTLDTTIDSRTHLYQYNNGKWEVVTPLVYSESSWHTAKVDNYINSNWYLNDT